MPVVLKSVKSLHQKYDHKCIMKWDLRSNWSPSHLPSLLAALPTSETLLTVHPVGALITLTGLCIFPAFALSAPPVVCVFLLPLERDLSCGLFFSWPQCVGGRARVCAHCCGPVVSAWSCWVNVFQYTLGADPLGFTEAMTSGHEDHLFVALSARGPGWVCFIGHGYTCLPIRLVIVSHTLSLRLSQQQHWTIASARHKRRWLV